MDGRRKAFGETATPAGNNALMPKWLQWISSANPLTYEVDGLRAVMLSAGRSSYGLGHDVAALTAVGALMITIASWIYPRMTQ